MLHETQAGMTELVQPQVKNLGAEISSIAEAVERSVKTMGIAFGIPTPAVDDLNQDVQSEAEVQSIISEILPFCVKNRKPVAKQLLRLEMEIVQTSSAFEMLANRLELLCNMITENIATDAHASGDAAAAVGSLGSLGELASRRQFSWMCFGTKVWIKYGLLYIA